MQVLKHRHLRNLLLSALLTLLPIAIWSKTYLVSVGISDYPGTQNDLRLPHNDAATMQWLYQENKNSETILLMNNQATKAYVKEAMQQLFSKATANDIVVMFFSGHGVQGSFVCYDGFLHYTDIRNIMSACKSKSKMVFADACFSGAFRATGKQAGGGWRGTNVMLFLSCRTNEKSIERRGMTNGFFTYALQHGLRGGADANRDHTITAKELFNYVSAKVKRLSHNKQHPVMWGKFPDTMPVMRW